MVQITKYHSGIEVKVLGWHTLWAFKDKLLIPGRSISKIYHAPDTKLAWWVGWRFLGTHMPGFIVAGTYYHNKKKKIWDVVNAENTVIMELNNYKFHEIRVEVQSPEETVRLVEDQIKIERG